MSFCEVVIVILIIDKPTFLETSSGTYKQKQLTKQVRISVQPRICASLYIWMHR